MTELETLRRAFIPEVLLPSDVAVTLQVPEADALKMMAAGELGAAFRVGSTVAVLRSAFLAALKKRGARGAR